ncbi:MAG: DUF302 domain-containing protein [Salinirussus sp.]
MEYTRQVRIQADFETVVATVESALEKHGFGILCDIDVRATMADKLDREFRNYRILGACNPPLAADALNAEITLGALLPCNVVVYETDDGDVVVAAVDPEVLVGIADNPGLESIADEVAARFDDVLAEVA